VKILTPEILILSNRYDFASDYVAAELKRRKKSYLRLNQEDFAQMEINLSPFEPRLFGEFKDVKFGITNGTLKSIFFRRPVFLRDNYRPDLSPDEQLGRTQWAAFYRGLIVFRNCLWVNHPKETYVAENKIFQLNIAHRLGFEIPKTIIANTNKFIANSFPKKEKIVLKTLDSMILKLDESDAFIYTNQINISDIYRDELSIAPSIFQDCLINKTDIRVTVIKDKTFGVYIQCDGKGVDGDWRLMKDKVEYIPFKLPRDIRNMCIKLVRNLGLNFGAIDLAKVDDKYYFLEINPTGEWAWLVNRANLPIDVVIADVLCRDSDVRENKREGQ